MFLCNWPGPIRSVKIAEQSCMIMQFRDLLMSVAACRRCELSPANHSDGTLSFAVQMDINILVLARCSYVIIRNRDFLSTIRGALLWQTVGLSRRLRIRGGSPAWKSVAVVVSWNRNNGNAGEPSGYWCLGPSTGGASDDPGVSPMENCGDLICKILHSGVFWGS